MQEFKKAEKLLRRFKAGKYHFGQDILEEALKDASKMGKKAILFRGSFPGSDAYVSQITSSLKQSGITLAGIFKGARPNSPKEDVQKMVAAIDKANPDFVITFGGGSNIDAAKAALVLNVFGGKFDDYFGVGRVSAAINDSGKKLLPHLAIQTIAG